MPITGGNVSLYNETDGQAIYPTPVIGVVGVMANAERALGRAFRADGDAIVLLGEGAGEIGGTEYLKTVHGLVRGVPPQLDLARERALQGLMADLADAGLVQSAHDCSDGGLAVTVAECAFDAGGVGAEIAVPEVDLPGAVAGLAAAAALFGESASRIVLSVPPAGVAAVLARAGSAGVPARVIGRTGGDRLRMAVGRETLVDVAVAEAERVWRTAIEKLFARRAA